MSTREASHAGSWYTDKAYKGDVLRKQLDDWTSDVDGEVYENEKRVVAVIAPHAGYSYSGSTAAFAYKAIQSEKVKRVFLIGPSHHHYLKNSALPVVQFYDTPLGAIPVDVDMVSSLLQEHGDQFTTMSKEVDEAEHSLEMHLPYIMHSMKGNPFKLVPIMVGGLSHESEATLGKTLAPFVQDEENLFVISSDFCHWGKRFSYTYYDKKQGEIYESIQFIDRKGMTLIEEQNVQAYYKYLETYRNTICGRHPIGVLLQTLRACEDDEFEVKFTHYAQSSQCVHKSDSSVSYASAVVWKQ